MKRVFLIVLDSVGAGAAPDAAAFGDAGAHTLKSLTRSPHLHIPTLQKLGIGNIDGLSFLGAVDAPLAAYGRLQELSAGKDTTIGHWELAGHISAAPMPTYPDGFPAEILEPFCEKTGCDVLCNRPISGTDALVQYGDEHIRTGDLIVYTSADSVFQIAAHEAIVPPETLYTYCRIARELLVGKHGVGRVIARPFVGENGHYTRTANRRDFSLTPPDGLLPQAVKDAGLSSIGVGKIEDIFGGVGFTETVHTDNNAHGCDLTAAYINKPFAGLCFVNLVDFDMLFGHRQDTDGYAKALSAFDAWLETQLPRLSDEDMLIITADHGCDPADDSTDHTREYVPLLVYGKAVPSTNFGTQKGFHHVAALAAAWLGLSPNPFGKSLL
ncbi:MAG: phosphopentomutase [Clostridia bacterium]|nr:phosphopentomutase [Clostridia bacterium]